MHIIKNKNIKWWLGAMSCLMLFVVIVGFAFMKMDFLLKGVQISASIDRNGNSSVILIKGNAKKAIYLTLNGREIFIDRDGDFTESVALLPGLSVVTLAAEDKFGKSSEKKFEVMYQESTGAVAWNVPIININ